MTTCTACRVLTTTIDAHTLESAIALCAKHEATDELLEACKMLEAADHQWANCPNCSEATSFPELCEDCMPLFDDARLKRRSAIQKAERAQC